MTETKSNTHQLTVKKGILAIIVMYACQIIIGTVISYSLRLIIPSKEVPIEIIGLFSTLVSGIMVLLIFWWDLRRSGVAFYSQIGLQASKISKRNSVILVIAALVLTHFLAWIYRSVILPIFDLGGIIGGGSRMFTYVQTNLGVFEMSSFLLLALLVGPIMEEIVFRGYLQSSLAKRIPSWGAILITSIVFTAGHSPLILWPMYLLFSVTWGWIYLRTGSLKMAMLIHILSNLFYTVVGFAGWDILA